jgi:hypothetical protein
MDEPRLIDTRVFRDETGAEVCWRVGGCKHEPFCHRRNLEGEIIETCQHCTYERDYLIPGGIQEYCVAADAPLSTSEWASKWTKNDQG